MARLPARYDRALLILDDCRVSGVLDFGDITPGDPAADLSLVWMLLPRSCHGAFRAAYATAGHGQVDAATWARGRGRALNLATVFLAWSAGNPQLHAVGRRTLTAVLAGDVPALRLLTPPVTPRPARSSFRASSGTATACRSSRSTSDAGTGIPRDRAVRLWSHSSGCEADGALA